MNENIFVYGTLRDKGQKATHTLAGYNLFLYSWFPFIAKGNGVVQGNIRVVRTEELPGLDRYEGVPHGLYQRERVVIKNKATGQNEEAWVYTPDRLLEGDYNQYPMIASGDWLQRQGE